MEMDVILFYLELKLLVAVEGSLVCQTGIIFNPLGPAWFLGY
jgi:hypothetical protein